MFSLLNPLGLWLGALLAVPLVIHFLGRQKLERKEFPSLMLVKEGFARSMRRHRIKNWLLLIIRTLLIACVLLALANPVLRTQSAGAKPDQSAALIHNGIYGRLPPPPPPAGAFGGAAARGKDMLETQRLRLRALDSAEGTRTRISAVIGDGAAAGEIAERFGDFPGAVRMLLAGLGPGTASVQVPVFAWKDLAAAQGDILRALGENAGLELALTDYSPLASRLAAFAGLRAAPAAETPALNLSARLLPEAVAAGGKVQVWLDGRLFQESGAAEGRVDAAIPLGAGPRAEGRFSATGGFAAPDLHFCFPGAGAWTLAHAGSALVSLPSLGRETYFRRIVHYASARDIPWGGTQGTSAPLRLVYLAAERSAPPDAYGRAVEFVKRGGRLIVAAGRESDIPGLNRFLLQPLRLGRLGNLTDSGGPVTADRAALSRAGRASGDPAAAAGSLGAVRKRYGFAPDSGTAILVSQGGAAVLAERDFHQGRALLWTTDIDDLEWTDLGVSPMVPLLHQAFQESADGERGANLAVAADSVYAWAGADGAATGPAPEVRDPEGRPFTRVRADAGRLRIGPFDRLGPHRIVRGGDTTVFAVNLLPDRTGEPDAGRKDAAAEEAGAREAFLNACAPYGGRVAVLAPDEPLGARASVRRLWPALVLGAILLLFLEGLIAARLSARRRP